MGLTVTQEHFEPEAYERFEARLRESLDVLRALLDQPGFGEQPASLGAELELSIIDSESRALPLNRAILGASLDPRLQLELDRFNLEFNLTPVRCAGRPFSQLEDEMVEALDALSRHSAEHRGRVVAIGILPTLRPTELMSSSMTDLPRYRALSEGLRRLRSDSFRIRISGEDPLELSVDDVTLEGAATSLQIHLLVPPDAFARVYNAVQLTTPLALAASTNSPTFLGHRLWDETRVALFKQSVDSRPVETQRWRAPARVSFGHGWLRNGAFELFQEAVSLFPPLLPVLSDEDPAEVRAGGGIPNLGELRLHQGTVWRWNRAIFDPAGGGHLRIEMRALPSGPTPVDMMAAAAFQVGLAHALREEIDRFIPSFPFEYAQWNFYRAAQRGLDAKVLWPSHRAPSPVERPVGELILEMLPRADEGLDQLGVDVAERRRLLGVFRDRVESGITPSRWQHRFLEQRKSRMHRQDALREMLESYLAHANRRLPIHEWRDHP
jgi:gamma-glutamyl:cysteine ligase YbdK (ATP-grasp superfamily)